MITDYLINIIWITVENVFVMQVLDFKYLKKPITFAPDKVDLFVMTCWSLPNYLIKEISEHHAIRSTSTEM